MKQALKTCWGIDVSKQWLDINTGAQAIRIDQTEEAIKLFIKKYKPNNQKILAILESTGGYERLIVKQLSEAEILVHIAHPNKVKAYAKAKGRLAKTDKIDAKVLRDYGFFIKPDEIKPLLD
jgi:transposase